MRIYTAERPYMLIVGAAVYPLTSEEAQRLLDTYPAMRATRNRIMLQGGMILRPATLSGGSAFIIFR